MLDQARKGATVLLNSPYGGDDVWEHLPVEVQEQILEKKLTPLRRRRDGLAAKPAWGAGSTRHADLLLRAGRPAAADEAIAAIQRAIEKAYGRKGEEVVGRNIAAIDGALAGLERGRARRPLAALPTARPCPRTRPTSSARDR